LDDQPQLCKYASLCPYLEQQESVKGFKPCYSTVYLGEEATCLVALAVDSSRVLVLDGRSGQLVFQLSLSESDWMGFLKSNQAYADSCGTICSLYLSLVDEYLPTRYHLDLWLVYSNGVDFSVVFSVEFCVKVVMNQSILHLDSIELLALPENIYPFQWTHVNTSRFGTSSQLFVSFYILGMDVGGPVAFFNPRHKGWVKEEYRSVVLVCNYSILSIQVHPGGSMSLDYWIIEELPCITSAWLLSSMEECCWLWEGYPCFLIGTIQGSIEWISMKDNKCKKIYQLNAAVKNLIVTRQFMVACDELGDGISIPLPSILYLSCGLNRAVVLDEQRFLKFSVGDSVQLLEKMTEDTFLLLSKTAGYQYFRIYEEQTSCSDGHYRCHWVTLIATSDAYVGWTMKADFHCQQQQEEEIDMVYIASDGSFLVVSSTAIANHLGHAKDSFLRGLDEEDRSVRYLFQQLDNTFRIQQRYECLFQQLQGEMSRLGSLLRCYDKMKMEIAENRNDHFHIAVKQVRRIETESCLLAKEDHPIGRWFYVTLEWTCRGLELPIPFCMVVQWKNTLSNDDVDISKNIEKDDMEILHQHTFHYHSLTSDDKETCERMEIPIYKTNGLSVYFRVFLLMEWNLIGPVLSNRRNVYPIVLELPCERNRLDILDFCQPLVSSIQHRDEDPKNVTSGDGTRPTMTTSCRISNPYPQKCLHSFLFPSEWNVSEKDWLVPIKTPWNENVVFMNRMETMVLQCSSIWSLPIFHSCLWTRFGRHLSQDSKQTRIAATTTTSQLEERWRDNKKVIFHSLQQAQNELQQAEQILEEMRRNFQVELG